MNFPRRHVAWWMSTLAFCFAWIALSGPASAAVRFDGIWGDGDRLVSLRADHVSRQQALELLTQATGWSFASPDLGDDKVDLAIRDQPAAKVLEMILSDRDYVANLDGERVTIALAPIVVSETTAAPVEGDRSEKDRDRVVLGGNLRIEKGERVGDVEVLGGRVDVFGVVEGDIEVMGGEARVHEGGHVMGDLNVVGGEVHLLEHSRVDGDVDVVGGRVNRAPSAIVGGSLSGNAADRVASATLTPRPKGFSLARATDDATDALTRTALLFLFGVIFWALGAQRMEVLEVELAKRPMRSLAMGVVGALTAALSALVLVVTILGIPFALAGGILTIIAAYVGACVVLSTVGQALLRHKTENRYIHLALGCSLFFLFTAIPYVGTFVWLGVLLTGLGAVVATRAAGLFPANTTRADHGPYRTAAT